MFKYISKIYFAEFYLIQKTICLKSFTHIWMPAAPAMSLPTRNKYLSDDNSSRKHLVHMIKSKT